MFYMLLCLIFYNNPFLDNRASISSSSGNKDNNNKKSNETDENDNDDDDGAGNRGYCRVVTVFNGKWST